MWLYIGGGIKCAKFAFHFNTHYKRRRVSQLCENSSPAWLLPMSHRLLRNRDRDSNRPCECVSSMQVCMCVCVCIVQLSKHSATRGCAVLRVCFACLLQQMSIPKLNVVGCIPVCQSTEKGRQLETSRHSCQQRPVQIQSVFKQEGEIKICKANKCFLFLRLSCSLDPSSPVRLRYSENPTRQISYHLDLFKNTPLSQLQRDTEGDLLKGMCLHYLCVDLLAVLCFNYP